tara:strand:- start:1651 stop:1896 length:246 start_codon:yes stop_codon:yes gene_type:complete
MNLKININDYARVKLTDHGRAIHLKNLERYIDMEYMPPKEDSEGYSRWQLWQLMKDFGSHMGNGNPIPFETAIEITPATWD